MNKNYIIGALLLAIVAMFIFNRNGQVELKDQIKDYKVKLKEIERKEDSVKNELTNLQQTLIELDRQIWIQKDSLKYYQESKQQAIDYYKQKLKSMHNASSADLQEFFTDKYPERLDNSN